MRLRSGGKVLDFEDADPDTDVFGRGKIGDFSWKGMLDMATCTERGVGLRAGDGTSYYAGPDVSRAEVGNALADALRDWHPGTMQLSRRVDPWPAEAFAGLTGAIPPPLGDGDPLPPRWHWSYAEGAEPSLIASAGLERKAK